MKEGGKKKGPEPWASTHLVSLRAGGSSWALAQRRAVLEGARGSLRRPPPSCGARRGWESRPSPGVFPVRGSVLCMPISGIFQKNGLGGPGASHPRCCDCVTGLLESGIPPSTMGRARVIAHVNCCVPALRARVRHLPSGP